MGYGTVRTVDEEGPVFQLRLNRAEKRVLGAAGT